MPVCPKAVQLLWSEQREKNKKTGFLSTQCTIQGQSGSPQESHLISSSLHVINLPAQCYCSAGHSSSFRGRGIDQAGTASVLHLCVSWANGKKNEQNCPEHTTHPVFVPLSLYMHARVRILDLQTSLCFYHSRLVCVLTWADTAGHILYLSSIHPYLYIPA